MLNKFIDKPAEDSQNSQESEYSPKNYPKDDVYIEFAKNFKISTQDKCEASSSKKDTNKEKQEETEKCAKCEKQYHSKLVFIGCCICLQWYCLSCSNLKRKETTQIKKQNIPWVCNFCELNDQSKKLSGNQQNLEKTSIDLRKIITDLTTKNQELLEKI